MQLLASRSVVKADPNDAVGDYLASGTVLNLGTTLAVGFE
jgi:hypothetical protein